MAQVHEASQVEFETGKLAAALVQLPVGAVAASKALIRHGAALSALRAVRGVCLLDRMGKGTNSAPGLRQPVVRACMHACTLCVGA